MKTTLLALALAGALSASTNQQQANDVVITSQTQTGGNIDEGQDIGEAYYEVTFSAEISAYTIEADYRMYGEESIGAGCPGSCDAQESAPQWNIQLTSADYTVSATLSVPADELFVSLSWMLGQPEPSWGFTSLTEAAVPEPPTLVLIALPLLGAGLLRRGWLH